MLDLLEQATRDNSLRAAFKTINVTTAGKSTADRATAEYMKYFVSTGDVVHAKTARFEKFSVTDPTIQTLLTGTTQPSAK